MNTHGMAAPFFIFCMQLYLQKQITILIVDQGEKNDQIICYSDNGIMVTKKIIKIEKKCNQTEKNTFYIIENINMAHCK